MRPLDLDPESRRALEFDALLQAASGYARTEFGAARVRSLAPASDLGTVRDRLAIVDEMLRCVRRDGRLLSGFVPDPRPALETLAIAGGCPEPTALRDLAAVLAASGGLRKSLGALERDLHPRLRELAGLLPRLDDEAEEILGNIEPDGSLADGASRELRRLRRAMGAVGERLRRMLEGFLRRPEYGSALQDDFVTQRNGRYVLPVRTDAGTAVRGIVHASSSSGATQFVEPLESVEMNNDLVRLAEQEHDEQVRILEGWSDRLRNRIEEIRAVVEIVGRVDSIQARALYGVDSEGVLPVVGEGTPLEVRDLRHPLLDRRLRETGERCVPLSLELDPFDRVLVVSGPNAGGKTVALKAIGLAVLAAQSGIPVPAAAAALPLYEQIRADIGDHQSIDADLSTFSAHVGAIARFLRDARAPALFLFDEIGTGTEPTEGAALARAVLETLRRPGMTAVATTHHGVLKAWAFTEAGARSAAMEFDRESLQPTYRLLQDAAGISAGLEIATRMGIPDGVVQRGRALLGENTRKTEAFLERLRLLTVEAEREREALARSREDLERVARRREQDAARERDRLRRDGERALERAVEELRRDGRREIAAIRDRREREKAARALGRSERRLRGRAEGAIAAATGTRDADEHRPRRPVDPVPGARVRVISLEREGEVTAVRGDKVEVRLGGVGFTVRRSDLAAPDVTGKQSARRPRSPGAVPPRSAPPVREDVGATLAPEIHLLGKTVDEAVAELDKYLDAAALSGYDEVRIVHGHGTGRLRKGVREFLSTHPHVRSQRPGRAGEGGDGATVVALR